MNFLKKNYEKVILGVVVVATLGLVAFLPIMVSQEKEKLAGLEQKYTIKPTALEPLDLTKVDEFISRAGNPVALNLNDPHKVFNPGRWQLKNNAPYYNPAGKELEKLFVRNITPLYEIYSLESVNTTEGLPTHYGIGITHQAAAAVAQRSRPKISYVTMNQTTNNFTVVEGGNDETAPVTLKLTDTGERVTITKDKPYKRTEGYSADLFYQPTGKTYNGVRKTDTSYINIANENYKIIDITEREVVLLQLSNQKTWIKEYNPTNSTSAGAP